MLGRKSSVTRSLGIGVVGLGMAAFVVRPALAEPPSHGFHAHPPHPVIVPAENPVRIHSHPVIVPAANPVRTHEHKPHPAQNPFANPPIPGHAHKPHPTLQPPPPPPPAHKPHPTLQPPPPGPSGHLSHKPHPTLNPPVDTGSGPHGS